MLALVWYEVVIYPIGLVNGEWSYSASSRRGNMKRRITVLTGCLLVLLCASTAVSFFPIEAPGPLAEDVRAIVTAAANGEDIESMLWALSGKYCPCGEIEKGGHDEEVVIATATRAPVAAAITMSLGELQAKTELELSDFVPLSGEIQRQQYDDEITAAQADAKEEQLNNVIAGKYLLETSGTVDDVDYWEYSKECSISLVTEYSISTGNRWADMWFKEVVLRAKTMALSADRCRSLNIGQTIVVAGEIEDSSSRRTTIVNATVK